MTLSEKMDLHRRFWRGEVARPLVRIFVAAPPGASGGDGYPAVDIGLSADDVVRKYRDAARGMARQPGDTVPAVSVNYGTALVAALAGGEWRNDGHTVWAVPTGESAETLQVRPFDPDLPLWRSYREKLRALVAADIADVLVAPQPPAGPMQTLYELLGPEQMALDTFDAPDAVRARAGELLDLWQHVLDAQREALGDPEGMTTFGLYLPGRSTTWPEDGLSIFGPRRFAAFYLEPIRAVARSLDIAFLHTHSAGLACAELLVDVDELDGVEISNDPNGPPLEEIVRVGVKLQQAGKRVMFSNWQKPLAEEQGDHILGCTDPGLTVITLTARDAEEAEHYIAKVRRRFGGG